METKKQVGGGQVKEKGIEEILRMKENFFCVSCVFYVK